MKNLKWLVDHTIMRNPMQFLRWSGLSVAAFGGAASMSAFGPICMLLFLSICVVLYFSIAIVIGNAILDSQTHTLEWVMNTLAKYTAAHDAESVAATILRNAHEREAEVKH